MIMKKIINIMLLLAFAGGGMISGAEAGSSSNGSQETASTLASEGDTNIQSFKKKVIRRVENTEERFVKYLKEIPNDRRASEEEIDKMLAMAPNNYVEEFMGLIYRTKPDYTMSDEKKQKAIERAKNTFRSFKMRFIQYLQKIQNNTEISEKEVDEMLAMAPDDYQGEFIKIISEIGNYISSDSYILSGPKLFREIKDLAFKVMEQNLDQVFIEFKDKKVAGKTVKEFFGYGLAPTNLRNEQIAIMSDFSYFPAEIFGEFEQKLKEAMPVYEGEDEREVPISKLKGQDAIDFLKEWIKTSGGEMSAINASTVDKLQLPNPAKYIIKVFAGKRLDESNIEPFAFLSDLLVICQKVCKDKSGPFAEILVKIGTKTGKVYIESEDMVLVKAAKDLAEAIFGEDKVDAFIKEQIQSCATYRAKEEGYEIIDTKKNITNQLIGLLLPILENSPGYAELKATFDSNQEINQAFVQEFMTNFENLMDRYSQSRNPERKRMISDLYFQKMENYISQILGPFKIDFATLTSSRDANLATNKIVNALKDIMGIQQ